MADDLTRRAIIAAHDAECSDRHCEAVHMPSLNKREQAIVARWREDREDYQGRYETSHESFLASERDRDVAEAEVERLTDWKESAMTVMSGLQDLGKELGLPLGESITGTLAAEAAHRLRTRAETAEAEVERLRTATGMADELGARVTDERNEAQAAIERALAVWRKHTDSHKPAPSACICLACEMGRALDGTEATDGTR